MTCFLSRFKNILQPIADVCIRKEQQELVDFGSFFTHTICHECCHGIGPHSITLPDGRRSTVRLVSCINFLLCILYICVTSCQVHILWFLSFNVSICFYIVFYDRMLVGNADIFYLFPCHITSAMLLYLSLLTFSVPIAGGYITWIE